MFKITLTTSIKLRPQSHGAGRVSGKSSPTPFISGDEGELDTNPLLKIIHLPRMRYRADSTEPYSSGTKSYTIVLLQDWPLPVHPDPHLEPLNPDLSPLALPGLPNTPPGPLATSGPPTPNLHPSALPGPSAKMVVCSSLWTLA